MNDSIEGHRGPCHHRRAVAGRESLLRELDRGRDPMRARHAGRRLPRYLWGATHNRGRTSVTERDFHTLAFPKRVASSRANR